MENVEITIIGGGVVGLAIAACVSKKFKNVMIVERHKSFGMETSSRSSEVIHAGIYYPRNSLKSKLCLEGNQMMYRTCIENRIPYKNTGKLIVATNNEQASKLPILLELATNNGVEGVRIIDRKQVEKIESKVNAVAALWCPSSGIVDSHNLMRFFESAARDNGTTFAYSIEVNSLDKSNNGFIVGVRDSDGSQYQFGTRYLINASGLSSDMVSGYLGIDPVINNYKIKFLKGIYFRINRELERFPTTLIYPVPPIPTIVGIHTCPDIAGGMRLGPYCTWTKEVEYSVDDTHKQLFFDSTKGYLPFLSFEELNPDSAGILPRLENPGEPMRDFIIRHEADRGLEGFVNLVGIESPGLTASPAIGKMVAKMIHEISQN
jgi:L-2-hydroxyglutarate oxidase LhgO